MNNSLIGYQDKSLPLVSIGIPTYNRAESLITTIESALVQDYQNIEIVISDNASTDRTEEICLNYVKQDNKIKYIRQPVNQGAIANFREVFKQSKGVFFMWLADDDWLGQKQYISECVEKLLTNPDYSLVCGKIFHFKDEKFFFQEKKVRLLQETGSARAISYYKNLGLNGIFYGLMQKDVILDSAIKNAICFDWFICGRIAFSGKVDIIDTITLNRSFEGSNNSPEKTIISLKLPERELKNIYLKIGYRAFLDILSWNNLLFKYGKISQFYLACIIFFQAWLFFPFAIFKKLVYKFFIKFRLIFFLKLVKKLQTSQIYYNDF
jgi:glycosyltransferase involved in cell wall biosynthesis